MRNVEKSTSLKTRKRSPFVLSLARLMPPVMSGSPPRVGGSGAPALASPMPEAEKRAAEARAKMEEMNLKRSEAERKKSSYQEWLAKNDAPPGEDGIQVSDTGVIRTKAYEPVAWDDAPDPPLGRNSMAPSYWLPDQYVLEPLDRDMTTSRSPPHPVVPT